MDDLQARANAIHLGDLAEDANVALTHERYVKEAESRETTTTSLLPGEQSDPEPDFDKCGNCGADAKNWCHWDNAAGWCCVKCHGASEACLHGNVGLVCPECGSGPTRADDAEKRLVESSQAVAQATSWFENHFVDEDGEPDGLSVAQMLEHVYSWGDGAWAQAGAEVGRADEANSRLYAWVTRAERAEAALREIAAERQTFDFASVQAHKRYMQKVARDALGRVPS